MKLIDDFSTADDVLQLEPEELADWVLRGLVWREKSKRFSPLFGPASFPADEWVDGLRDSAERTSILNALLETWPVLLREGMIAPACASTENLYVVSRRGREVAEQEGFAKYLEDRSLPAGMLHPTIHAKCWRIYMQGDFDTAVFQAFKALEVAVREAGGYTSNDLGTKLMRNAFNADKGSLRDVDLNDGERKAIADLFAGAIGACKNPSSHRDVEMEGPEAAELLVLASYLMRIVDQRRSQKDEAEGQEEEA